MSHDLACAVWANIERHERSIEYELEGINGGKFGEDDAKRHELLAALLSLVPIDRRRL